MVKINSLTINNLEVENVTIKIQLFFQKKDNLLIISKNNFMHLILLNKIIRNIFANNQQPHPQHQKSVSYLHIHIQQLIVLITGKQAYQSPKNNY